MSQPAPSPADSAGQQPARGRPEPSSAPAAKPGRMHVFYADGRSLCDQYSIPDLDRARGGAARPSAGPGGTVCAPCVVVAQELVTQANSLIREFGPPSTTAERAVGELARQGSRWPLVWDLDAMRRTYKQYVYRGQTGGE